MDGRELGPTEAYAENTGLCFFINNERKIYDYNKLVQAVFLVFIPLVLLFEQGRTAFVLELHNKMHAQS